MSDRPPSLAEALVRVQAKLPHVGKDKTANTGSYSYKYADLADITTALLPVLSAHGLAWSARPTLDDAGRFVLAYSLMHESGEREDGAYPLPDPTRATPQQVGSAVTYGRRYCLLAVTGLAVGGDDDDGAAASTTKAATPDPLAGLKRQVWTAAKAKGIETPADLAERFAEWSQGELLADAEPSVLAEFLAFLNKKDAA